MSNEEKINFFISKLEDLNITPNSRWAIYGTGKGAELVFIAMERMGINSAIKIIIDRDDKVNSDTKFCGISVVKLLDAINFVDGILIAAMNNHEIIYNRIQNSLCDVQKNNLQIIDLLFHVTKAEKVEYVNFIEKNILRKSNTFIEFDEKSYCRKKDDVKAIAWYLPQFHQIDINNKFHGQGFTEWTNTSSAIPMFTGHYQPHIPYDVGYYDLLNADTLKRQIYLAKQYGIYGFCIHYYWFSGKRIMEKPLELLLEHKELDIPFCFNWATENWTALWDGGNKQIMLEHVLNEEDDEKFMADILPYMKDSRYIKIEGKPVLVIYRVDMFRKERIYKMLGNFRKIAQREGFSDLYIMLTNACGFQDTVTEWGADALVEFPPHGIMNLFKEARPTGYLNPYYNGIILDATTFVKEKEYFIPHNNNKYFRSVLTSWDNTARKATSGGIIITGLSPTTSKQWLRDIIIESQEIHSDSEHIIFVNSWNEWAEGSHLEPDMKYGYAYLQVLKDTIEEMRNDT